MSMKAEQCWILCKDKLPAPGQDVILCFRDSFHLHPSWPKTAVMPAWRANVGEPDTPDGLWAIEGRLWQFTIQLEDGIAWMKLPDVPEELI